MDPFGGSAGVVGDLSSQGLKNGFNDIPANDIDTLIDSTRVKPVQVSSGVQRGTQRIVNVDGSYITLGEIPNTDGEFGIAFFDRDNNQISKTTGETDYKYDVSTGKNYYQAGKLPDGTYGIVIAQEGYNVEDVI